MDSEWEPKGKDPPSKRTAARDSITVLGKNTWPILVVPGIMGSRLRSSKVGTIWDPDDKKLMLGLMTCSVNDLARWFDSDVTDVEVMSSTPWYEVPLTGVPEVPKDAAERGWFGPVWGFYGSGICEIQKSLEKYGAVVYAFGYDWRQCNQKSGYRLIERIEEIVKLHGQKVHIVTHSMGGLVTRAACRTLGARATDLVGSVVHGFMPALGAPEAYLKYKRGEHRSWGLDLSRIVGDTPEEVSMVASGIRSLCQLLPTHLYPKAFQSDDGHTRLDWLVWDDHLAEGLEELTPADPWKLYLEPSGTLGLVRHADFVDGMKVKGVTIVEPARRLDALKACIRNAERFHQWLGRYVHPITLLIVGEEVETECGVDIAIDLEQARGFRVNVKSGPGDGSVTELSGGLCPRIIKKTLRGVKHDQLFNVPTAQQLIIRMLIAARETSFYADKLLAEPLSKPAPKKPAPKPEPVSKDPPKKDKDDDSGPGKGGPGKGGQQGGMSESDRWFAEWET